MCMSERHIYLFNGTPGAIFGLIFCYFGGRQPHQKSKKKKRSTQLRNTYARSTQCEVVQEHHSMVLSEVGQRPVGDLSISGGVCIESLCQRPVNIDPSRSTIQAFFVFVFAGRERSMRVENYYLANELSDIHFPLGKKCLGARPKKSCSHL